MEPIPTQRESSFTVVIMDDHIEPAEPDEASHHRESARLGEWLASLSDDIGPGLPTLPDGRLPKPETSRRRRLVRFFAVSALCVSAIYLTWRTFWTVDFNAWFVAIPLLALEVHNAVGLGLYTFSLWDVDPLVEWEPVDEAKVKLALFIPTLDESIEVLLPVISAALAIEPPHETWVLDDGNRPEIGRLALGLGARYLARDDNTHAKAGNLNNALIYTSAEIIGVVDADHVVSENFFRHTLGYFEDPKVAVVQTPQDFYNVDSFEHQDRGPRRRIFNEQAVFYRLILPAKNRWKAGFWCGTGAVIKVSALREIGGVATSTVTEDIHTSIRLQKRGWKILVHNEVLARGLAASNAGQYMLQRRRWARGAMQVLRRERFMRSPLLSKAQRVAYATTLFAWFDSLRTLFYVLLPISVLVTGSLPINASLKIFAPMFLGTFLIQHTALRLLARGYYPPWLSLVFEMLRMPAVIPALGEVLQSTKVRFRVTPKGRTGDTRDRTKSPPLIVGLLALSIFAFVWFGLTLGGLTAVTYSVPGAMFGTLLFLFGNFALLVAAARRIAAPRHASERRASVRFPVSMVATIDGEPAIVEDASLTGVRARVMSPFDLPSWAETRSREFGEGETVRLDFVHQDLHLKARIIRSTSDERNGSELGLEFDEGQWSTVRDLALVLFHGNRPARLALDLRRDLEVSEIAEDS
jgi:cellulose synthase (UDP-forming)